jgi:hypothetical protein
MLDDAPLPFDHARLSTAGPARMQGGILANA